MNTKQQNFVTTMIKNYLTKSKIEYKKIGNELHRFKDAKSMNASQVCYGELIAMKSIIDSFIETFGTKEENEMVDMIWEMVEEDWDVEQQKNENEFDARFIPTK